MDAWVPFELLRPWWLLAALPAGLVWIAQRRAHSALEQYRGLAAPHLLEHLVIAPHAGPKLRPDHLLVPWLLIAVVAMAGPSWRQVPSPFAEEQAGVMVVLRVAESMAAADLPPSRLERAQHKLNDLAELREGGTLGLIAYDGSAHLVMPLTRDNRVVVQMAQALEAEVMPVEGDALADAIELAQRQLGAAGTPGSVLVMTDSVTPEQTTRLGASAGIPVQFLATVSSAELARQGGVTAAAGALGADLELASVDDSDVRAISRRAESVARSASAEDQDRRDEGYLLIWPLLLGALWWSRRGWSMSWA